MFSAAYGKYRDIQAFWFSFGGHVLSIYSYSQASDFLKDAYEEKRKKNPLFSIRSWARMLGLESHAPLHLMMSGRRPIPRKYIPFFIQSLSLGAREGLYFENLVELSRCKDQESRQFYLQRISEIEPKSAVTINELESFRYLGNPLHSIIIEMSAMANFSPDPSWIQKRLVAKYSISEIESAIDRIFTLGLLVQSADGKWQKTNQSLTSRQDVVDLGCQEYHQKTSQAAQVAVVEQNPLLREFQSFAMNIDMTRLPEMKSEIRAFMKNFIQKYENETANSNYQLNIQFFSNLKNEE